MKRIVEALGWVGVVCIILAYVLVSFNFVGSSAVIFQGLNLFGAVFLIASSYDNKDWQPIILNIVWAGIAIVGLIKGIV